MDFRFNRPMKALSIILIALLLWEFCGFFEICSAFTSSKQAGKSSQQSAISSQSSQPRTQKPEERFQKVIEDITQIVSDTSTDTDTKKNKLKGKKSDLESYDVEIRKSFTDTEKFLKEKNLPNEILSRHRDFVARYDSNLAELKGNLDSIEKSKNKSEADAAISRAKAHLEKVKPPKKHIFDPNKLPHRTPEIKKYEIVEKQAAAAEEKPALSVAEPVLVATSGSLDGLLTAAALTTTAASQSLPTAADLAETIEVQFTPEIKAKAQELGNSPVKLYEFVRNNFTYEPYYGSLKGSQQTLLEMAGNDIDLASVLIGLLRAANVPARYSCGTIELSTDDLMNWLGGVKNPNTAAQIMATNGIPGKLLTEGGTIKYAQFDHCWVEAFVDMFPSMGSVNKQGKYWTPIDPSMKEMDIAQSVDISKGLLFDETNYINSADEMPPVLAYIYKLKDYYNTNYDYNFTKIFHVTFKKEQEFGIFLGTLPYKVINEQRYSEMPDTKRHKIRFGLLPTGIYDTGTAYSVEKTLPEIAGKKLTISLTPATSNDQAVINNYGGLLKTPVYLINVKPEIKLNDTVILSGPEIGMGTTLSLTAELSRPNSNREIETADITHGISYAIGIPALDYPGRQLLGQIDILRNLQGTLYDSLNSMDTRAGDLLQNIAIEYFGQLNGISKSIESIMHIHNTKLPSIALVSADVGYSEIFGITVSPPIMKGLSIDAFRVACSPISLDGNMAQRREFTKQRGLNSSYLEHKILENLLEIESISAVKALQIAAKNGIPVYAINRANIDSILPMLTISTDDKIDIQNAVNAGKEVTVSRDNITLYEWTGVGYIVRDPNTGSGAYMISGSIGGGGTVKASNPAFDKEQKLAWFIEGRKTKFIDNFVWWYDEGLTVFITASLVWHHFGYTPDCITEVTNAELVRQAANHPYTWIFYYAGHSGYDENKKANFLYPTNNEWVYPSEIQTDCKIVFLNSCFSFPPNGFDSSFDIDGKHEIDNVDYDRGEAYIGWRGKSWIPSGTNFAVEFWLLLGKGKTVEEAINTIKAIDDEVYRRTLLRPFNSDDIDFIPKNNPSLVP